MPIYEYGCSSCGVTFEKFQKMGAESISEFEYCPNYQEGCEINRLISAPVVKVKDGDGNTVAPDENPALAGTSSPDALLANRNKGMKQQMNERLQAFMKFAKKNGK